MATAPAQPNDLIRRAYVNLKAIRDNMPQGFVYDKELFKMFNKSLEQLRWAGIDVSEWGLQHDPAGNISSNEFLAKIDAILMYFAIEKENVKIGFQR